MALSKTISDRGSHGHHTFTLTVTETAVNKTANTSTCSIKFTISPYQTGYNWEDFTGSEKPKGTVTFNGTSYSWDLPNYNGKSTVTLVSKTGITVKHGSDGKKTVSFSFSCSSGSTSYLPGSASGSGSLALTSIARYPTVTVSNTSKTETSITMKWSSDLTINRARYRVSTNGGSTWGSWTSKTASAKSGSYTISSLNANTSYTIQTELRSSESGLTSTANKTVKTYAWPCPLGTDQYVYRDGKLDIDFKNPLERNVSYVIKVGDTVIDQGETDGLGVTLWDIAEDMLPLIPNSNTGTYTVTVTYSGHTATATGTFYATGANPKIDSVVYQDSNTQAQAIIQDNQKILQNISEPAITATGSGLFGATLASGTIEVLGNTRPMVKLSGTQVAGVTGTIDSATDVTAKATVIDSRGNSSSQTITITMAEYTLPSAIISLARRNNYYSDTDITVDANVMDFPGNTPTITAQWKEEGAPSWEDSAALQDNVQATLNLNNEKAWTVQVTVTDSFGGSTSYNLYVGIGLPILYIDRMLRAVGINCFPEAGEPFAVEGVDILDELFYKPGDKLSIDGTGTGGAPFTGYVTSSTTTIRFMVPTDKSLANITTITCNVCTGGIRGISGYVDGSRDNTDWTSGYTITCTKATDKIVQVEVKKSSALSNVTNNTPIAYAAASFELEFS